MGKRRQRKRDIMLKRKKIEDEKRQKVMEDEEE